MTPHWEYWVLALVLTSVLAYRVMKARAKRRSRRSQFYCNPFLDLNNHCRPNVRTGRVWP